MHHVCVLLSTDFRLRPQSASQMAAPPYTRTPTSVVVWQPAAGADAMMTSDMIAQAHPCIHWSLAVPGVNDERMA